MHQFNLQSNGVAKQRMEVDRKSWSRWHQPNQKTGKASWWRREREEEDYFTKDGALRVLARAAQMTMQPMIPGV